LSWLSSHIVCDSPRHVQTADFVTSELPPQCALRRRAAMAKPLTPITIANLKARPRQYEVSDGGCAGLRVVVFPTRRKSFVVRYRFRRLQRKLTLGPVLLTRNGEGEPDTAPELDTPLSLAAARELATKALRQARAGNDPAAAKRKRKQERYAAEANTLEAIAQEHLPRQGPRLRTLRQRRADLELLCKSPIGQLPIDQITRGQLVRVLDHIADHNGPVRSDRARSALRTLLNWHAARSDYVPALPRGGRKTSIRERARTRTLSDPELRKLWTVAGTYPRPFGAFIQFLLLTGARRNEAAGLHRDELSEDGTIWIIPAHRYKSGRDTLIPLSRAAQRIIAEQPPGDFVFGVDGSRPFGGFDRRKKDFDAKIGFSDYVLHDLRRTARTLLSRAGVAADIAEMCLGHVLTGVRGTYDLYQYRPEKTAAFEALVALIERIVHPPEAAVADITLERGKRRRR